MIAREPALLSLATCEAPHAVAQDEAARRVVELFGDAEFDAAAQVAIFANAGIRRRTIALPLEAYFDRLSAQNRNRIYLEVASSMLAQAAERAVPEALRERITHVVSVSSTGIATPSLEVGVVQTLGLDPAVRRIPVFGLGCGGGVAGFSIARDLAQTGPDALVLLLCVELTSLTLLSDDKSLRNFVACAIFGDGAAAALVGRSEVGARGALATLGPGTTRLFPGTEELMGWDVRDDGWRVVFAPRIPKVVSENVAGLLEAVADRTRLRHYLLHPGGRKILEAYRSALELSDEELAPASCVLADHGNMSAATVFFVLHRVLSDPGFVPGPGVMTAFGPGFSAELMTLELARGELL